MDPKKHPIRSTKIHGLHRGARNSSFSRISIEETSVGMMELENAVDQVCYIELLSDFLNYMIRENDCRLDVDVSDCCFQGTRAGFDATYYLKRISTHCASSPYCMIAALIYLERLSQRRSSLRLTSKTIQRLLLVAVMTATKYLEDICCLNTRWAATGELTLHEINALELEFLFVIEFELSVQPEEYARCVATLRAFAASQRIASAAGGGAARRAETETEALLRKRRDGRCRAAEGASTQAAASDSSQEEDGRETAVQLPCDGDDDAEFCLAFSPVPRGPVTPRAFRQLLG
uniref:Cyclin n=1 Tax=Cryptomonas curvata TaxID=233186 RepID=A0A7S0M7S4_9CRYP|mmetsp:Transcript_2830/g.6104  ORF Transcript_2830/g.6104 Transcript_2830/m.6104 type:complete len:291 (+) Transcript_2830:85-957(+)